LIGRSFGRNLQSHEVGAFSTNWSSVLSAPRPKPARPANPTGSSSRSLGRRHLRRGVLPHVPEWRFRVAEEQPDSKRMGRAEARPSKFGM